MSSISSAAVLEIVDSMAVVFGQAYQLARVRLASAASPVLRLLVQRDYAISEIELYRRELNILRSQRMELPPHRRPDYRPEQRLAILQLRHLRGWSIGKTARRLVVHPNTIRSWIKAVEGHGNARVLSGAIVWNRIDDAVRWAAHELRRLCPEVKFGSRTIARHLVRAGIAMSRSSVQRVLREPCPVRPRRAPMAVAAGVKPHHLLKPKYANQIWHMDLLSLRVLWFRFTLAAILDGFSRKILAAKVYRKTPRSRYLAALVRTTAQKYGTPQFLITDHGCQFRKQFHAAMNNLHIRHVKGPVRAPHFNGKVERLFRTLRFWWRLVLCGNSTACLQRRLDDYRSWYNEYRPHSALNGLTPDEAWEGASLPEPMPIRSHDSVKPWIDIRRLRCCGDPRLPVIQITVRRAA
jgi:putative transposase